MAYNEDILSITQFASQFETLVTVLCLCKAISFPLVYSSCLSTLFQPSTTASSSSSLLFWSLKFHASLFPPSFHSSPSHQEGGDGPSGDEPSQDIVPVVSVFSYPHHPHQHGQRQQHQAQGGLGQTGPFGSEHQGHVHLEDRNIFEIKNVMLFVHGELNQVSNPQVFSQPAEIIQTVLQLE